mmetsp:Transcript_14583/g.16536  ORF Transcript_14583/g.16536 Transcript_14583/m.16536 type:complete len:380 (+) Transcript_14583:265-1404(+)
MNPSPPPGLGFNEAAGQRNPAGFDSPGTPLASQMSQGSAQTAATTMASSMSVKELRQLLTDFYDYHDPFKTPDEITDVLNWTKRNGIKRLNRMLRKKYKEDLVVRDDVVENRHSARSAAKVMSTLIVPGLVAPDQEEDYDLENGRARRGTVVEEAAMRKMLENSIDRLEQCTNPEAIRNELFTFYSLVQPDRLAQVRNGTMPDFTQEIMQWTFRFGLPNLVKNLREKYLGEFAGGIQTPDVFKDENPGFINAADLPARPTEIDVNEVRTQLLTFYETYNPEKAEQGVEDLIKYVKKKGIEKLNAKLRARYNDDLSTFQGGEKIEFKKRLFERLVAFYSDYDPNMIGQGLAKMITWVEKHGEEELNTLLRGRYNADLSAY